MEQGIYLYCLARLSRLPGSAPEGPGLDGQSPLQLLGFRDLAAVWSRVALEEFCGPQAAERLQDLNWIGPRVIRHQQVVAAVMRHSPVLPARFGTIFSSEAGLEGLLRHHHDTIARSLDSLQDREEWAVKGMLDRTAAREKLFSLRLAQEADQLAGLPPGKRYFQEQRLRGVCEQELSRWLQGVCRGLWHSLLDYTSEVRERPLLSREAAGGGKGQDMVLNWAFLVPGKAVPGFQAHLQEAQARCIDHGLSLQCTGPWPPYSFCPNLAPES